MLAEQFGIGLITQPHPIPEKYHLIHLELKTCPVMAAQGDLRTLFPDRQMRLAYD